MCDLCENPPTTVRGDLLLCASCARPFARNVSARGEGWVKCHCGYDKPVGTACGLPCM